MNGCGLYRACILLISLLPGHSTGDDDPPILVTLGDSITKGARAGVAVDQTFSHRLEQKLKAGGRAVRVVNQGVGGETTAGALARIEKDVLSLHPTAVAIMYGTNDCWVDAGKKESRISTEDFRANLVKLVTRVRTAGAIPILMTEPCYAKKSPVNGLGEHGNVRLAEYMQVCRQVAKAENVPLIDQFDRWKKAMDAGENLSDWTTDGYHPNPRGHKEIADFMETTIWKELPSKATRPR